MKYWSYIAVAFLLTTTASAADDSSNKTQEQKTIQPAFTRTSLQIARSLDPSETELLSVKSKNGEVATLIVKRREGRKTVQVPESKHYQNPRIQDAETLVRAGKSSAVPKPVEIRSETMFVKDEGPRKKGRTLSIDSDGVPVIEGVREPDTEDDKRQTWRNARVIEGVLVPYKQSLTKDIPVKNKDKKTDKQEVELTSFFEAADKSSPVFKENEAVRTQWKGLAESMPLPYRKVQVDPGQTKLMEYIMKINQKEVTDRKKLGRSLELERRMDENVDENGEPLWVNNHPKEIWTEQGKISVADRRNEENVEDDDQEGVKFLPMEARLLQPQGISNYPASTAYSPSRVSFEEGVRTPVLQYAHPELGVQVARVDVVKEGETSSEDPSLPSLSYFSDDPYADRSPYAYEPGLLEDTLTSNSKFHAAEVPNSLGEGRRHTSIHHIEFTTSQPTINPDEIDITEPPRKYEPTYGLAGDKYIKRYPYYYGGGSYPMTKEEYYKWKMSGMSYGNNYKGSYVVKIPDNRPFWEKLTDSMKETVQSGVESLKDLTRPVMEPLVEATQRISENLGIQEATAKIGSTFGFNQGTGMRTAIQEKIGDVASSPVLLPALGLVAGGAALGLGAVAVGKMLDVNPVNLLKRSEDGEDEDLQMEHKRAMEGVQRLPESAQTENIVVLPIVEKVASSDRHAREHSPENDMVLSKDDKNLKKAEGETVVLVPVNKESRHVRFDGSVAKPEGKNELKRLIDESGIEALERFHFNVNEGDDEHKSRRRSLGEYSAKVRRRRNIFDIQKENEEYLDNLLSDKEVDQEALISKMATLGHPNDWSNTPCAKKMFCDVMTRQSRDAVLLMEKKMSTFLSLIQPPVADSVAYHLHDVMSAVHLQDCSRFFCLKSLYSPR